MKKVKANTKLKSGTPMFVEFLDPCSIQGWRATEDWAKERLFNEDYEIGMPCTAVGFLVHLDERGISLCAMIAQNKTEDIGDIFEIPRGCIKAMYVLEE